MRLVSRWKGIRPFQSITCMIIEYDRRRHTAKVETTGRSDAFLRKPTSGTVDVQAYAETSETHVSEALPVGEKIAECFGTGSARSLVTRPLQGAELTITHLWRRYEHADTPVVLPADDAFLVVLYLIDVEHRDIWPDRPPAPLKLYPKGSICLISLTEGAAIAISGGFEAVVFHIPRLHLAELADKAGELRVDDLAICRGIEDRTIRDIGAALMPLFGGQDDGEGRLLAHVGLAFSAHIAHQYGRSRYRH